MIKAFITCILFLMTTCMNLQAMSFDQSKSIDSHLDKYAEINVSQHDNIDDDYHSHVHKHSENGKEHEHQHQHRDLNQVDIPLISKERDNFSFNLSIQGKLLFFEPSNILSSFIQSLFRPPIA